MNSKTLIGILVALLVIIGIAMFAGGNKDASDEVTNTETTNIVENVEPDRTDEASSDTMVSLEIKEN